MSSPNHPTSNIKDAFSLNFLDFIPASLDYVPTSPGKTYSSSSNSFGVVPIASPSLLLFHNDPYMKVLQAFYAKESPIPPPNPITPPVILTPSLMPPKRTSTSKASAMTHAAIRKLVADSVATALEAQVVTMASTNNPNRNSELRKTHVARECTYEKFMSCQPFYFNGTKGAVGLIRRFKQTKSVFSCSNCTKNNKVKFAINTLTKEALFLWNSFAQPIGVKKAYKITWSEFKSLLIKKYYPQTEIKKMKEAITMTQKLIERVMKHNSIQKTNNHKRKLEDRRNTTNGNKNNYCNNNHSNDHNQQQNRRQETFKTYTATNGYTGNRPLRVPYDQRNNLPQHPRIVYSPILDINHFLHFLVTLENLYPMDDEPMWAADRVVALTPGSAITVPETTNEFAIKAGMPNYGKFLKELISNKHKIKQISAAFLSDESSAMIQNKVPPKLGDPESFLIPCNFNNTFSYNALANLDASINLMPYSLYAKLSLETLKPIKMSVRLAARSFQYPVGIAENMLVEVDVIDEILEEDFDALLDEGSKILHSIEGTILEEEIFAEFDEFMAMTADITFDSEYDIEEPPFKKITINTDYKIKTSLEEPHTNLKLKTLPDNLEYVFMEEPSFLPVIISSQLSKEKRDKLVYVLKKHKQAFAWKIIDISEPIEVFKDDSFVFGQSFETCLINFDKMLQRCEDAHLVLIWEKYHFMVQEGIVLGHKVSSAVLEVEKAKIDVISKLPPLLILKVLEAFSNTPVFTDDSLKIFRKLPGLLLNCSKKDTPFKLNDECQKAFESLKEKLTCAPVIVSPNWNLPFELMCDASDFAVGAVLDQKDALRHLFKKQYAKPCLIRWILLLQEFNIKIKDRKCMDNVAADHLSRIKNDETSDDSEVDDNFPGETLMEINTQDEPWFVDFANYLVDDIIPKRMTYQQ
nr:reverse transcriptase domain-containing protein [Tanacetum cinerariifolium]